MNLDRFNPMQKEAILTTDGPVLILAGAGSGKTTVVVNKIAYILEKRLCFPSEILAITFTNKAANEMKTRIEAILSDDADGMWINTFHSACMKILRRNIEYLGYSKDFVIYDSADQKTLIKRCLKELNIDEKHLPYKSVLSEISSAKDNLLDPVAYTAANESDYRKSLIANAYTLYQKRLLESNALDFDDIIMLTVRLFSEYPEVLLYYQNRFKYIFVDEYQDTNNAQYLLSSALAGVHQNICVVGDDDQSIYKFRGANINNILDFEREFPAAKVIKLEQNYRSTQSILNAANAVISNNLSRKGKKLWTENGDGEKIDLYRAENEYDEAYYIADSIKNALTNGFKYSDCAILYRTNAQSRIIETTLSGSSIPYRVLAGLRFYDRKEVKDALAYLRLVFNPADNISLIRVVNEPARKIGTQTLEKVAKVANENGLSMYAAMQNAVQFPELSRVAEKLVSFTNLIDEVRERAKTMLPSDVIELILMKSGYIDMLTMEDTVENQSRLENIEQFKASALEYEKETQEPSLSEFLETTALVADVDNYDETQDSVVLMTLHSSKGLEFPYVFLCGMEEGLFPSSRSILDMSEIEEERRLCYVGITRAKKRLSLSYANMRRLYNESQYARESRFLSEIPDEYINLLNPPKNSHNSSLLNSVTQTRSHRDMLTDIMNKKAFDVRSTPKNIDFKPGDVVSHRKFGKGMVLSITPSGTDVRIEIAFDDFGTKSLMGAFAKLKKEN
ncbi:MAG: ATP-dependent DNA helicase PcrA [Ruminococcaceae bacterium]|nr:ATP-dependent DNA helicase PcrA [Oscillospiraceae bacterium]